MDQISAAGNLTIEMDTDRWRLIGNGASPGQLLLEAVSGQPLHYVSVFAAKRRLPDSGSLPLEQIQRIVLGWSNEDEAWHLGLLLEAELAQERGSRWCELARWPDPDTTVFVDIARQAGRSLAGAVSRPFNFIEPEIKEKEAVAAPPPPLPELPLTLDLWTIEKQNRLQLTRAARWRQGRLLRSVWYTLLALVYIVLSVVTLTGVIALPKPEFLPYLGLAVAALLIGMVVYMLYQVFTSVDKVIVDSESRSIRGLRGKNARWRLTSDQIKGVYVSQIVAKRGKKRTVQYGELNLCLSDNSFRFLLDQSQFENDLLPPDAEMGEKPVAPMNPYAVYTDLQAAGLYLAQTLDVPCYYDQRPR
jgi:hypothetical protein